GAGQGRPGGVFSAGADRPRPRRAGVPASIARIARLASAHGVPLLSHDDESPEQRRWFRSLGCRVSEFPMNIETARDAADANDAIVLGAPTTIPGKATPGWTAAARMIADGRASWLAPHS